MKIFVLVVGLFFSAGLQAQEINKEIFVKNIAVIYDAAAAGFKSIKTEQSGTTDDGDKKFASGKKVSGAKEVFIKVDAEDSHTYVAHFEAKDLKSAQAKAEEMANMVAEQLKDKGLVLGKGTDMNYEGYRKHTIDYESDNIDLMGKYPSLSIGIVRGSNPPVIEMLVNEPLWK